MKKLALQVCVLTALFGFSFAGVNEVSSDAGQNNQIQTRDLLPTQH